MAIALQMLFTRSNSWGGCNLVQVIGSTWSSWKLLQLLPESRCSCLRVYLKQVVAATEASCSCFSYYLKQDADLVAAIWSKIQLHRLSLQVLKQVAAALIALWGKLQPLRPLPKASSSCYLRRNEAASATSTIGSKLKLIQLLLKRVLRSSYLEQVPAVFDIRGSCTKHVQTPRLCSFCIRYVKWGHASATFLWLHSQDNVIRVFD